MPKHSKPWKIQTGLQTNKQIGLHTLFDCWIRNGLYLDVHYACSACFEPQCRLFKNLAQHRTAQAQYFLFVLYVIEIFTVHSSIYEMGMQSLTKTLPKEKRDVKQVCALCTPASVVYPWRILKWNVTDGIGAPVPTMHSQEYSLNRLEYTMGMCMCNHDVRPRMLAK